MTLRRGFKTLAERLAMDVRAAIEAPLDERLDLDAVAAHVGATVLPASDLVPIERLREIERIQAFAFSACTFEIKGRAFVVYNPLHRSERTTSDVSHELAHIVLEHELREVAYIDGVPFRTCKPDQEEEATTLAGALLLPRPLLLAAARSDQTPEQIAAPLGVTTEMARFRWNTTGVARQVAAARQRD